jgi:hypothetical protein
VRGRGRRPFSREFDLVTIWAQARARGLASDEFWELTPRLLHALQDAWLDRERLADKRAGELAALYYNAHKKEGASEATWESYFPDPRKRRGTAAECECDSAGIINLFRAMGGPNVPEQDR